jgi:transposase-like protein
MTDAFKWRQYEGEIILTCVRWYLRYALSYRDLEIEGLPNRWTSVQTTKFGGSGPYWRSRR